MNQFQSGPPLGAELPAERPEYETPRFARELLGPVRACIDHGSYGGPDYHGIYDTGSRLGIRFPLRNDSQSQWDRLTGTIREAIDRKDFLAFEMHHGVQFPALEQPDAFDDMASATEGTLATLHESVSYVHVFANYDGSTRDVAIHEVVDFANNTLNRLID